jgi:lactoylglutathione lyase
MGNDEAHEDAPDIYPMPSFVSLDVRDLRASVGWYRGVLGFDVIIAFAQMAHVRWIKYADVLLRPGDAEHERGSGVTICFQTPLDEVDALAARAARAGAQIIAGPSYRPWNTRDFIVADPDGYRLCFTGGPVNPDMSMKGIADRVRSAGSTPGSNDARAHARWAITDGSRDSGASGIIGIAPSGLPPATR